MQPQKALTNLPQLRELPESHGRRTSSLYQIYHTDAFEWLKTAPMNSIEAVVTDPPYGLVEYSDKELTKLKNGKGGIWRLPPSFDGSKRMPIPRFTVLTESDQKSLRDFSTFGLRNAAKKLKDAAVYQRRDVRIIGGKAVPANGD